MGNHGTQHPKRAPKPRRVPEGHSLPTAGSFSAIMRFYSGVDPSIIFLDYINDGGVYKWRLRLTESATEDTYPQTISVDTWYCLEILYDSTNDLHKLWVDGAERISFSASVTGAMDRFSVGYPSGAGGAITSMLIALLSPTLTLDLKKPPLSLLRIRLSLKKQFSAARRYSCLILSNSRMPFTATSPFC
jgi:hypothetical protein